MNLYRQFKSFAPRAFNPQRWLGAVKRKAVRVEVAAISLLLLPVILVMADHLPFIDVPSNAFYHDAVSAVYGARITTGTTPTTFSPDDFVTRGQMAAFLHRGLGRVAYGGGIAHALTYVNQEIALLTIDSGGAAGGTGFLKVDAAFTAYNNITTDCPCEIRFYLSADDGPSSSPHWVTLYDNTGGARSYGSGTATLAFPFATDHTQNVRLWARMVFTSGVVEADGVRAYGSISAIWAPFGATGGNTISAASTEPGNASQGPEPDANPDAER